MSRTWLCCGGRLEDLLNLCAKGDQGDDGRWVGPCRAGYEGATVIHRVRGGRCQQSRGRNQNISARVLPSADNPSAPDACQTPTQSARVSAVPPASPASRIGWWRDRRRNRKGLRRARTNHRGRFGWTPGGQGPTWKVPGERERFYREEKNIPFSGRVSYLKGAGLSRSCPVHDLSTTAILLPSPGACPPSLNSTSPAAMYLSC